MLRSVTKPGRVSKRPAGTAGPKTVPATATKRRKVKASGSSHSWPAIVRQMVEGFPEASKVLFGQSSNEDVVRATAAITETGEATAALVVMARAFFQGFTQLEATAAHFTNVNTRLQDLTLQVDQLLAAAWVDTAGQPAGRVSEGVGHGGGEPVEEGKRVIPPAETLEKAEEPLLEPLAEV